MNIGIVEIIPNGHLTLVECVAKIFLSDRQNRVTFALHKNSEAQVKTLFKDHPNVDYAILEETDHTGHFLNTLAQRSFDRIYLITIERLSMLPTVYNTTFTCPLYLFIHNIDFWFEVPFIERAKKFVKTSIRDRFKRLYDNFEDHFYHFPYTGKLVSKILRHGGGLVVLNGNLKKRLIQYVPSEKISIIPFSYRNNAIQDHSGGNTKIRLCLPGYVTQQRRDYLGILNAVEQHPDFFARYITLDFLGGIKPEPGSSAEAIVAKSKHLLSKGVEIILYERPNVAVEEFDEALSKADFVLANLNMQLGYGKTKESGIQYAMIKAAKPGIFQEGYPTLPELEPCTLYFQTYEDLVTMLQSHIDAPESLVKLKQVADAATCSYLPEHLYTTIR
jgi:hypothetical protein